MIMSDKLQEECAVFGVSVTTHEAAGITYNGLLALQHRGQESSGIAVGSKNNILFHKNVGLVQETFTDAVLARLPKSGVAVGHNRYSTTGGNIRENAGPFITEFLTGRVATAHNGNVTNAREIKKKLEEKGLNFTATSDSEVVSSLIAYHSMREGDVIKGVKQTVEELTGAFSLIILYANKLIVARDGNGFRPLCLGKSDIGMVVSSESCALDSCGFEFVRDVKPGELLVIENGEIIKEDMFTNPKENHAGICIFEYVYFARPDSVVDELSVYQARYNMGYQLAKEYPVDADIVCGVPDSGLEAAVGYSAGSGIPFGSGFVKNRYIGRSFIYPTQSQRESAVKLKLNPLAVNLKGKKVILVDDSIVRGTTIARIVQNVRNAGAKEVHIRVSSPPFKHTCHYGTDVDNEENLIANQMTNEEICKSIGADSLGFISVAGIEKACAGCSLPFCTNCFTGNITGSSTSKKSELE